MAKRGNGCLMSRLTMSFLVLSEWFSFFSDFVCVRSWTNSSEYYFVTSICFKLTDVKICISAFWRIHHFSVMFSLHFSCIFTWPFFNYLTISLIICCSINPISGSIICACTKRENGFVISIVPVVTVWMSSGTDKTLSILLMSISFFLFLIVCMCICDGIYCVCVWVNFPSFPYNWVLHRVRWLISGHLVVVIVYSSIASDRFCQV